MSVPRLVATIALIFIVGLTLLMGMRAGAVRPLGAFGILLATIAAGIVTIVRAYRGTARRAGYGTIGAYLRAVPRTDDEKREAVDLALQGLLTCFVGVLLPPLLLIGVFPLDHGARKVLHASMGLGLVDDLIDERESPRA